MSKKISVIIPVYKVENYLHRCVDSILAQSYCDLEIILVDDGSPDGSPEICDKYAESDHRIRVVHKRNGGLSSARNAGIDNSTGDFVTFVDSDDWIAPDTYEHCINMMNSYCADVVQYGYMTTKVYTLNTRKEDEIIETYKGLDILRNYLLSTYRTGSYSVCRCLFPRSAIGEIRFREGKINEDIDFKYKVLRNTKMLAVTNIVKYFYYQHGETISSGGLRKKDYDLYESAEELYKLAVTEKDAEIEQLALFKKLRTPFSLLSKIAYFGIADDNIDKQSTIKQLTKEHRKNAVTLLKSPMTLSRKILVVCFALNYNMANTLINLVKKINPPI